MKPVSLPLPWRSLLRTVWIFVRHMAQEFVDKKCQRSAAALTYMTLFAMVPMMTVTYAMFSMVPAFDGLGDRLQTLIFDNFVPETGTEIQQYLASFSSQALNLTLPGVGLLVVTAYLMLTNIEKTFNTLWGVQQARRGLWSFLLYWAVLTIGPIFLGAGLVVSTYLLSLKLMLGDVNLISAASSALRIVPVFMATMAFTLLFAAVPNCRVPLKDALIGGLVTAIFFELAKTAFAAFVANANFQLVYGAFAVVPVFLIWVNALWMIILLGAVFVRTLAEKQYIGGARRQADVVAVLWCLALFRTKAQTGEQVSDHECIQAGLGLVHWQRLRWLLVTRQWIAVTDSGNYVLARDLQHLSLWDVMRLLQVPLSDRLEIDGQMPVWLNEVNQLYTSVQQQASRSMALSLEALFAKTKP